MSGLVPKINSTRQPLIRLTCLILALITLVLYWPVRNFEFNNYDDAQYLTQKNPNVQNGDDSSGYRVGFYHRLCQQLASTDLAVSPP